MKDFPLRSNKLIDREHKVVSAVADVSFDGRRGRDVRARRRVGLRQDDDRPADRRPRGADRRARSHFEGDRVTARSGQRHGSPTRRLRQMMFQDPYASLDPRMRVRDIIAEPLDDPRTRAPQVADASVSTSCSTRSACPPTPVDRYPHEFSGGQRQRIGLARALAVQPEADHRRRAGLRARRLDPGADPQPDAGPAREHGLSYIFISHDLAVVHYIADRSGSCTSASSSRSAPPTTCSRTPRTTTPRASSTRCRSRT